MILSEIGKEITGSMITEGLKKHFGFNQFKGTQEKIISSIIHGKDTFVIMPTGGGKSLCYQLPAIMQEGTAIVISPLIALMKNQVDLLRGYSSNDDIAHFLNSSLNKSQVKEVKQSLVDGKTKLLYLAPETLGKEETIEFLKTLPISFVAVDEAHCISEWGHDFRPEYRRIKDMIDSLGDRVPVIALTATATPKVQNDIQKTLKMEEPNVFVSSFNRENLYYEIRPKKKKEETIKNIIQFIKANQGKSGIVYCLNRKTTEEVAEALRVNGISAGAYHAGMDSKKRTAVQDGFLMEDLNVICATIAFGMGIDKPDIRFVVHIDIPKSLENYYQETGRAGRDGLEGKCIAYFSHNDINKLEKFLRDKTLKEREIGGQHLLEVAGYCESTACRRKFILHYFGEKYKDDHCSKNKMCDNCANPKKAEIVTQDIITVIKAIQETGQNFNIKYMVEFLMGRETQDILAYKSQRLSLFAAGKEKNPHFWNSIIRHALLGDLIRKDIEDYGVLKIGQKGLDYIVNPFPMEIALNHEYSIESASSGSVKGGALDPELAKVLRDIRKIVAKEKGVPPFVVFQDASLDDMATQYPISMEEMANIVGVSQGKAMKYGAPFLAEIKAYVEENDIERPLDFVVKQIVNKSKDKVYIIQNVDKKIPLETIALARGLSNEEFFDELESIIQSGTKLNLNYHIEDVLDEDIVDDVFDYFMEAETDEINPALEELDDEGITFEDVRLVRLKFLSEVAN